MSLWPLAKQAFPNEKDTAFANVTNALRVWHTAESGYLCNYPNELQPTRPACHSYISHSLSHYTTFKKVKDFSDLFHKLVSLPSGGPLTLWKLFRITSIIFIGIICIVLSSLSGNAPLKWQTDWITCHFTSFHNCNNDPWFTLGYTISLKLCPYILGRGHLMPQRIWENRVDNSEQLSAYMSIKVTPHPMQLGHLTMKYLFQ